MPPHHVSTIGPGRATLEEHHEWSLKLWNRMDRDQSGSITRKELDCEEFRDVLKFVLAPRAGAGGTGGAGYTRAQTNIEQAIDFCLRKADFNHDTSLSFEEFKSFLIELRSQKDATNTANLIFALFDIDYDQRISKAEFREIYRYYLGHHPTADEFEQEWARLDRGGHDEVNREEYTRWLQTSSSPLFRQHAPPVRGFSSDSLGDLTDFGKYSQAKGGSKSSPSREMLPGSKGLYRTDCNFRAKWNQNFNTRANPNKELPSGRRVYFSRPQSLPELSRYYSTKRGFEPQLERLNSQPDIRRYKGVLSTDSRPEMIPIRSVKHGTMRNPISGRTELWNDSWQEPASMKKRYPPVTLLFQCPGQVPRSLLQRTEEDY